MLKAVKTCVKCLLLAVLSCR